MKKFEFKGDWEMDMNLEAFMKSNLNWTEGSRQIQKKIAINVRIHDFNSYDPDPLEEQIETLNYIRENETLVVESLCAALDKINIVYGDGCGEHDWYPSKLSKETLGKIILIQELSILTEHKDGRSYFQLSCEYKGDLEHGLYFIMHNDRLIEYAGGGDLDYAGVYKDLGEEGKNLRERNIKNRDFGTNEIHKPLAKYGKFKPWQLNATSYYFDKLIREKNTQQTIEEIENNNWDINLRFPELGKNLLDKAAYLNNTSILEYLIDRGGDSSRSMQQCMSRGFYHKEAIELLVKKGVSIDAFDHWGNTPLCIQMKSYIRGVVNLERYMKSDLQRVEKTKENIAKAKEKINYYLALGANPKRLNKDGSDYKAILRKQWNETFLEQNNIFRKVEELIFTSEPKEILKGKIERGYKSPLREYLVSLIKPAIKLVKTENASHENCNSKIGGLPKLGKNENWPRSKTTGKLLLFLLQIDLKELNKFDSEQLFPKKGMLNFYFAPDDWNDGLVKFYEEEEVLVTAELPEEFKREEQRKKLPFWKKIFTKSSDFQIYKEFKIKFEVDYQIPHFDSIHSELFEREHSSRVFDYYIDDHEVEKQFLDIDWDGKHHLLGYYFPVQEAKYELSNAEKGYLHRPSGTIKDLKEALDWIVLLQLVSDRKANMNWVDAGNLFFFINKADLADSNFSKTIAFLDTT